MASTRPPANLEIEWRSDYQVMLAGHGDTLTATQRMEGNAEAVFESSGIGTQSAAREEAYRADVEREIDAIAGAMKLAGLDPNAPLTEASYLLLSTTLQGNPAMEELALQGHGVQNPPSARYKGAYGRLHVRRQHVLRRRRGRQRHSGPRGRVRQHRLLPAVRHCL